MTTRTVRSLVGILQVGLIALVLLTPLPFGSVQPNSMFVIELVSVLLGTLALVVVWLEPSYFPRRARMALLPVLALVLIATLQLIPLGEGWARFAGSRANEVRDLVAETVAIDPPRVAHLTPPSGLDALLRFGSYIWIGLAAAVGLRTRRAVRTIAIAIAVSAGFQALYGAFECLSGRQQIFGYMKEFYTAEATGTFINRNHYAGYLAMALPMTLALLTSPLPGARFPGWRERILRLSKPSALLRALMILITGTIWIGVVLSYSRAGLAVALISGAILAIGQWRRRWTLWLIFGSLLIPIAYVSSQQVRAPGERMTELADDVASDEGRIPVWSATARIAADHPLLGTGFGSFDSAFPLYRPPAITRHWQHAHNDWLQAAAEGGWAAPLLLALLLWQIVRRGPASNSRSVNAIRFAATAGIVALALHSFVDFPAKMPAVAVLAAVLAGLRCADPADPAPIEVDAG